MEGVAYLYVSEIPDAWSLEVSLPEVWLPERPAPSQGGQLCAQVSGRGRSQVQKDASRLQYSAMECASMETGAKEYG